MMAKRPKPIIKRNAHGIVTFQSLEDKHELKLVHKTIISPNTRLFRFKLLSDDHVPGLKPGEHILLSATVDGKTVERKYTPVSADDLKGYVELVIKIYPANIHPNFPKGGVFSQHLERLEIGDTITFSGPVTRITYEGNGDFLVRKLGTKTVESKHFNKLGIVVGGTGLTPMLRIVEVVLQNPNDKTQIWMLFANNTPQDVLLKEKLDELQVKYKGRFTIWYTVSTPDGDWKHSTGHVNQEMLAKHLPPPSSDVKIPSTPVITFHNADQIISLPLVKKTQISPNTHIFRFRLPSENHVVGLRPGQHIKMHYIVNGKEVSRKYTHTSDDDLIGYVDFLVKIYHPNVHPEYPDGGIFTPHLDNLKLNDNLNFSGPVGRITYFGNGNFRVREKGSQEEREVKFKRLAMVAGGSGLTPLFQVINAVIKDPNDHTEMWLLFANQTPDDILLKDDLDRMAAAHPTRFHVWYTVNKPGNSPWNYSTGYINEEMLSVYLPKQSNDLGVLLCGPKAMKNNAVLPNLANLGFSKEQIIVF
ncbi:Cytochrome-b5 reductase [Aphelenchoides bicaudatus]|nr:Cytochrome-b5 reductase [Aphelenchoides bicaudatus]